MANRQRRQGVVYGPVRPPGSGRSSAEILGRILGFVVVVVAMAVLGVGALTLLNARPAGQPTPVPTPVALISPSPEAVESASAVPPSPSAAATVVATATAVASPSPTPVPSPTAPLVQLGPGFVTFGTNSDSDLRIVDPRSTFGENQRIHMSAFLLQATDSSALRTRFYKADPAAANGQRLIREDPVRPRGTTAQIFLRRIQPSNVLEGPGLYTVQYVRNDDVLAEGAFLIEG